MNKGTGIVELLILFVLIAASVSALIAGRYLMAAAMAGIGVALGALVKSGSGE